MKFKTTSIIIARKNRNKSCGDFNRPCFISLFDVNNPHKTSKSPKKIINFDNKHKIEIENLYINYLLAGNDLVINNLEFIDIKEKGEHLIISGKQK